MSSPPKRVMTQNERRKVQTLTRRRDYLNHLLDTGESDLSWDRAEASALTWAIRRITSYHLPHEDFTEGNL